MNHDYKQDKVAIITDRYFGKDKTKNYIKHDFKRALEGFIQREVLLHLMIECSRNRHDTQSSVDSSGNLSITYGDFDPDNAGFLYSIFKNHELGSMLDLRLLLTNKEAGTGGSFVKEVLSLNPNDFIYHYLNKKENSTVIPSILTGKMFQTDKKGDRLSGQQIINDNRKTIESATKQLISKANDFNSSNYKERIVTNYEALKFHKDRQPTKYEVNEVTENMGAMKITHTSRKDVSIIETKLITKAMNEFAEIVELYRMLASSVDGLYGSSWSLDTYVKRTFELFSKRTPIEIRDKVVSDLYKNLKISLDLSLWSKE